MDLRFLSLGKLRDEYPCRALRLAVCRNEYVKVIKSDPAYAGIDFVVVVDLDEINNTLGRQAVESCWDSVVDWDACFANSAGPYYDIWALRHRDWMPFDCWKRYHVLKKYIGEDRAFEACVQSAEITIDPQASPIEVESAFGGVGIYKSHLFKSSSYPVERENCGYVIGRDEAFKVLGDCGRCACEHVGFHEQMKDQGARLFILPNLVNGCRDRGKTIGFGLGLKRKLKNFLSLS